MTVNVKLDLLDISSTVQAIDDTLNNGMIPLQDKDYCSQLCGALRSYRGALEEESLRYDPNSYDVFEINKVLDKINKALEDYNG